jgi:hypothetical protein
MYGYANESLMFFELPLTGTFRPKVENAKMAKVTVEGDAMTIPEIIEQLKWIVPFENFKWEVTHYHGSVYKVKFPNQNEVQRMKHFKTYPVPLRASDLVFDDWAAMDAPDYVLPEVWVHVSGLPADARKDFLALWGLGSLFGMTSEVDMAFTRKHKILRIRIGCMDHTLIPKSMDLKISGGFYRLQFEVEGVVPNPNGDDVMRIDEDDNGSGGDDDDLGRNDNEKADMDVENSVDQSEDKEPNVMTVGNNSGGQGTHTQHVTFSFGSFPPSPINLIDELEVKNISVLVCDSLDSSKKSSQKFFDPNDSVVLLPLDDKLCTEFQENPACDPMPIIGGRGSTTVATPMSVLGMEEPRLGAPSLSAGGQRADDTHVTVES